MNLNDKRINAYKKTAGSVQGQEKKADSAQAYTFPSFGKDDTAKLPICEENSSVHDGRQSSAEDSKKPVGEGTASFAHATKPPAQKMRTHIDDLMARDGLLKLTKKPQGDSEQRAENVQDSIYRRVAKFLLLIGVNEAARILPHLPPEQTERIIPEIASIRSVHPDEASVILAEFQSLLEHSRHSGGLDTARAILEKAFGPDRAQEMLNKSVPYPEGIPFDYLQEMDGDRLHFLLKDEGIPVQTLVLSRIKPASAAAHINRLEADQQKEIILRLAKMTTISPDIVRRVDRAMQEKVQSMNTGAMDTIDGRGALAEILKKMDAGAEKEILSTLAESDPELGNDIRERLFTIDDIVCVDDRFIQEKLREMSEMDIAFLIAAKPENFRQKILSNVSKGRGDLILEEENMAKPMRRKDIDDITDIFFSALRRAWEDGKIIIKGRDEDIYV